MSTAVERCFSGGSRPDVVMHCLLPWVHEGGRLVIWITRARPKTDRIACPWLIRHFIDPDAEILYVPADQVLDTAAQQDARSFDAPGAEFDHRDGKCTFEVLIDDFDLSGDAALVRLAGIVRAADIDSELHTDP